MATILRGKRKGEEVTIDQFCNDWVTAWSLDKSRRDVFGITALQFTAEEMLEICGHDNTGMMFTAFEVVPFKNRFRRRKF